MNRPADMSEPSGGLDSLTFCPNLLFSNYPDDFASKPSSKSFNGAVFIGDVCGFSAYSQEMCQAGAKGLDSLHRVTNDYLGHVIEIVYNHGGDVISFAGDALICIFRSGATNPMSGEVLDGESCAAAAIKCAWTLRNFTVEALTGHFGVSYGVIKFAVLGGLENEWTYMMSGPCICELKRCIDSAKPQEVVCTTDCFTRAQAKIGTLSGETDEFNATVTIMGYAGFDDGLQITPSEMNSRRQKSLGHGEIRFLQQRALSPRLLKPISSNAFFGSAHFDHTSSEKIVPPQLIRECLLYLPRAALPAINSGSLEGASELREVTTMFLSLDSFDIAGNADPLSLQPFFLILQEVLKESGGFLRQFLVDDKGCVAIAMWGVPMFTHANDCSRGLYCAYTLSHRVSALGHRCSIGLSTGNAYCGIIGSSLRRDYACIGAKVNFSARLMSKARGKVYIDPDLYSILSEEERSQLTPASQAYQLKGYSFPVTPYTFIDAVAAVLLKRRAGDLNIDRNLVLTRSTAEYLLDFVLKVVDVNNFQRAVDNVSSLVSKVDDIDEVILVGEPPQDTVVAIRESPSPQRLISRRSFRRSGHFEGNGEQIELSARLSQRRSSSMNSATVKNLPFNVLVGTNGSGKGTAIGFVTRAAVKVGISCVTVKCIIDDESTRFSVVKKVFFEVVRQLSNFDATSPRPSPSNRGAGMFRVKVTDGQFNQERYLTSLLTRIQDEVENVLDTGVIGTTLAYLKKTLLGDDVKRKLSSVGSDDVRRKISLTSDDVKRKLSVSSDDARRKLSGAGIDYVSKKDSNILNAGTSPQSVRRKTAHRVTDLNFNLVFLLLLREVVGESQCVVVIDSAQFCDLSSWSTLQYIQERGSPMKIGFLVSISSSHMLSMQQQSTRRLTDQSRDTIESTSLRRYMAVGSAEAEFALANKDGMPMQLNVLSKPAAADWHTTESYKKSASFRQIRHNPGSRIIMMKHLTVDELSDALMQLLHTDEISFSLVERVWRITSGNANWIMSVVHFIRHRGVKEFLHLVEDDTSDSAEDPIITLMMLRLEKLSSNQTLILKYASVLGDEFSLPMLTALLPNSLLPQLSHSIAILIEEGLIRSVEESPITIFAFDNQLFQELTYDRMPPSEAAVIHEQAARYLEDRYHDKIDPFYLSLAYHYGKCDAHNMQSLEYTIDAAEQAVDDEQYKNALMLLEYGLKSPSCDPGTHYHFFRDIIDTAIQALEEEKEFICDESILRSYSFSRVLEDTSFNGTASFSILSPTQEEPVARSRRSSEVIEDLSADETVSYSGSLARLRHSFSPVKSYKTMPGSAVLSSNLSLEKPAHSPRENHITRLLKSYEALLLTLHDETASQIIRIPQTQLSPVAVAAEDASARRRNNDKGQHVTTSNTNDNGAFDRVTAPLTPSIKPAPLYKARRSSFFNFFKTLFCVE